MGSRRYTPNYELPRPPAKPRDELLASLTRINLYSPPVQTCSTGYTFHGLYRGPTSIAYLFYRLHTYYPDLVFKGQTLLDWSEAYLDLGENGRHTEVDPDHCGTANETLARLTLRAALEKDGSLAGKLCSYSRIICAQNQGSDEWLYGRVGYLYFLRLARNAFQADRDRTTLKMIKDTIGRVVARIIASPQPWVWHGKEYLGAAHGSIGILTQMTLSGCPPQQLEEPLTQLLSLQFSSGNFPSSHPPAEDRLVQFCHGSPGFVLSLKSIRSYFLCLQSKIDEVISAAQANIWKRGLLSKMSCLCHGIAGNALSLEDEHFNHFLSYMTGEVLEHDGWLKDAGANDGFTGLYTGEAGRAWIWAVADKGLDKTCIGYNDL